MLSTGKFGARLPMVLSLPYLVIPLWIGYRLLKQPRDVTLFYQQTDSREISILKRPVDLLIAIYFCIAAVIDIFRGLIVLGCQEEITLQYVEHFEPYLLDPSAYPKIQMLIFMFYFVPYYIYAVYGLLTLHQTWLADLSLLYTGAAAQGQFTHIGASLHSRTPFKLRVPASTEARVVFWVMNGLLLVVPLVFAYKQNSLDMKKSSSFSRPKSE